MSMEEEKSKKVKQFLEENGFGIYADKFKGAGLNDLDVLLKCSESDLDAVIFKEIQFSIQDKLKFRQLIREKGKQGVDTTRGTISGQGPTSPQTQQVKINLKFVPYTLNSVTFLEPVRNVGARNKIWHIKYKGEKLFAKVGDMWNEKKIVKELLHESSIYSILQKFQGEVIPYLKYSGPVYGVYVLATSICGKSLKHFHLNSSDLSEIKDKAWTGLKKIHSLNVLHGDIRLENIIWNSQTRRVYWIDFGFSRQNFEWKELIEEENNFNVLFDELIHNEILH